MKIAVRRLLAVALVIFVGGYAWTHRHQFTTAIPPVPREIVASDHVGPSPVGTTVPLLHKTFIVAGPVHLPFSIPPHAANAQLHGTYRSFLPGKVQADEAPQVELLLLNEQQYANFTGGRPAESLFSASGSDAQEINVSLPPTLNESAKYCLIFRNSSANGKALVQADFRIDF
jgi:hypothetical protein